jgi:hypothetical protein
MLCNCGAELYKPVIGDQLIKTFSELPVDEPLILMGSNIK